MADLNNGKFQGLDENAKNNYANSFKGATKVAEKVKKGGTETKSDGYVVDAIDIDWGGLKLTTIAEWRNGLQTVSSTEQNAGKGDNTKGIHSTAYLLNLISSSFTQIYNEIGGNDDAGLRRRIAYNEASIKAMANLSPTELASIQSDLTLIKQELAGEPVNTWTTLVDKLAYLGDDTVVKYVNDAVAGAKTYADTKKSEAISAAASDATTKANNAKTAAINAAASDATSKANTALSNAKTYADTKKTEAINAAASDATTKANNAKTNAISAANNYTDTKFETLSNTAFKVSRIEEGNEGILVFSTVSSYAG